MSRQDSRDIALAAARHRRLLADRAAFLIPSVSTQAPDYSLDDGDLTLRIEKRRLRKWGRRETGGFQDNRPSRASLRFAALAEPIGRDAFSFDLVTAYDKRRLAPATVQGRFSRDATIGLFASWRRAGGWRLSAGYSIRRAINAKTGLERSIQLSNGAASDASRISLTLEHALTLARMPLLLGIDARGEHISSSDARALALPGRYGQTVALRLATAF